MNIVEKTVLNRIQDGIPLVERPFKVIADELYMSEKEVIEAMNSLRDKGKIRRFGGIFDVNKMGIKSTLACMRVDSADIDRVSSILNAYRGITHNYERDEEYNIWFTIMESSESGLKRTIEDIVRETGIEDIVALPSIKKYKTKVILRFD